MFMFLPFLIALYVFLGTVIGKDKVSYILWGVLLFTTALSFVYHVTDPLNLSF
jgi:VIT1/CCC1 family predicted Fe2+/Mn2+ transporter